MANGVRQADKYFVYFVVNPEKEREPMKISLFTVCLPDHTPEEGAAALASWGFDGVEWRVTAVPAPGEPVVSFWKGNRCTLAPETLVDRADEIAVLCRKHKLGMPCLGAYLGYQDAELIERVMQAAARMQVPLVRVSVAKYDGKENYNKLLADAVKGWEKIVALGKKHGVKPVAEIHMGTIITSASAAYRFASHFKPDEMGIIHDCGNMVYEGFENHQMGLEILGPYLAHVHIKNSVWAIQSGDPDGNLRWASGWATLRNGQVNLRDFLKTLRATGYDDWLSLEDFSTVLPLEPRIRDDLAYIKQSLV
jgi:sugar phosphate isomerase/epimerase